VEILLEDPDLEERRSDVFALEDREDLGGVRAGAVVERERQLTML
jgi:hypothetical protein